MRYLLKLWKREKLKSEFCKAAIITKPNLLRHLSQLLLTCPLIKALYSSLEFKAKPERLEHYCFPIFIFSDEDFTWNEITSLVAQRLKHLPAMRETWVRSLGWEDPLEKEMATHPSILAWRIPWTVYGVAKSRIWLSESLSLCEIVHTTYN